MIHPNTWHRSQYYYWEDVFGSPDSRGQGLARSLSESVSSGAHNQGNNQVDSATHADHHPAQGLYARLAERTNFIQYRHTHHHP